MPAQACRTALLGITRNNDAAHAGLVLSRYLRIPVKDEEKKHPDERQSLFGDAMAACRRAQPLYSLAYQRWKRNIEQASHAIFEAQARGRLIVGLGGENVLETGLTLHHVYGTPVIPGSALKGLTAHYCAQAWGSKDAGFKPPNGTYYNALFGTTDDSGHIVFHDAWITPESLAAEHQGVVRDVMTPHHGDYYMSKPPGPAPTDSDMPTPVSFLAASGTFLMAVSSDIPDPNLAQQWSDLAATLMTEALQYWGIGGKTSAGYGRMARSVEGGGGNVTGDASKPRFKVGDKVLAKRIPDPKGRERAWFEAEDGFQGMVRIGDTPPAVEIGKTASLFVSSVTVGPNKGYAFSTQPVHAKPPPQNKPGKKR